MRLRRFGAHVAAVSLTSILVLMSLSFTASAATNEPPVSSRGWYWQDYQKREENVPGAGVVTIETPNPFCPSLPGSLGNLPTNTCAEGRLPVEIRASDYKVQNKFSAIGFDLFQIPQTSKVSKFTVTFLEAKSGCYDGDEDPATPCQSEQTSQFNAENKTLQACVATDFFTDGEARPPGEAPKYECSSSDATAKREAVKSDDPAKQGEAADHLWTFDLTALAKQWIESPTPPIVTGIVVRAAEPKEGSNAAQDSNWRVVLAGPNFKNGVRTNLIYTPAKVAPTTPFDPGPSTEGTTGTTTFTPGTPGIPGTPGDLGSTDTGETGGEEPVDATPGAAPTAAEVPSSEAFPGYMWLAIIAGLVGFSLVRSMVIESVSGIRPNGVLAQIKSLNARPDAAGTAASTPSPFAGLATGAKAVGAWLGSVGSAVTSKLPFGKKG